MVVESEYVRAVSHMFCQFRSPVNSATLIEEYARTLSKSLLQRRANIAERVSRNEAERASRIKSDFIATMSHELRTPLNSVIGFSELIANMKDRQLTDEQVIEYATHIHESAGHLLNVINDILNLSKIQSGRIQLQPAVFELKDLVMKTVAMLAPKAEKKGVKITARVESQIHEVIADRVKFRQVLINLIDNAIKYTRGPGTVGLSCEALDEKNIRLLIVDTGIGMDERELELARIPFGQVDSSHSRLVEGTGLGLPIAEELIKLHGGTMTILSAKNIGTEIEVILPINSIHSEAAA